MSSLVTRIVAGRPADLPPAACRLLAACMAAAAAAAGLAVAGRPLLGGGIDTWGLAAALAAAGSFSQLYGFEVKTNYSYYMTTAVMVCAVLLVPMPVVALIALVIHLPEWALKRYPWYMQTFNIANVTLSALAAAGAAELLEGVAPLAELAAAAVFFAVNSLLLAEMLRRARGHSYRTSGLFERTRLELDFCVCVLGVVAAALWRAEPWLVLGLAAPVFVAYRALSLPRLEEQARTDAKTGLLNSNVLLEQLDDELVRARRFRDPLTVLMLDLDHFKRVNDHYGHSVGDQLLAAVAAAVGAELRDYDLAGRFGGEEFTVVLPRTDLAAGLAAAERIRAAVAGLDARSPATVSIGVACSRDFGADRQALIEAADGALYRAKANGRNQVAAARVPFELDTRPEAQTSRRRLAYAG